MSNSPEAIPSSPESHQSAAVPSAAAKTGVGTQRAVLAMLLLAYIFNFLDRQILGMLAAPIKEEFGLTDAQLGLMGGLAFAVFYTGLGIPVASLADRSSRTWIMTIALTLWSGFTAACGLVGGYWQLFLCRMGVGVGEAGGVAPAYSLISDYFPKEQRARALAVYSFGIPIGSAAGLLFGGLLAEHVNWRFAFISVGVAGLVLAPMFRMIVKEPPRAARSGQAPSVLSTLRMVGPKGGFWLLALGAAASSTCAYGIAFWLPSFFMRSFHMEFVDVAQYLAALNLIGGVAGIWGGGWLADRLGTTDRSAYARIPAVSFLIAMPVFVLAMNVSSLWVAFVLFLVPQALNLVWLGPVLNSVQHMVPAQMRSTASAIFLFINNLIGIGFGTWYMGKASDLFQPYFGDESLRWSIYSGMVFYLFAAALFFFASRRLKRDWVE